jgi:hypothetical protein
MGRLRETAPGDSPGAHKKASINILNIVTEQICKPA